jgi:hypothetical protein
MASTSPLRTGVPACVMGLLREEAGSQHLAMSQRSPQFSQALNEFCSGLIKCYEDAHLDYKEEIAALFDKAEDESDRSATEAPAPAQPFVPDPTQSPQVNALREQSHRVEQEISAMQHQLSERRDRARDDDSAVRRLGDVSAIVHDTTVAKLDASKITELIAKFIMGNSFEGVRGLLAARGDFPEPRHCG